MVATLGPEPKDGALTKETKWLFEQAVRCLDSIKNAPAPFWTLGGGTALAMYFNHRESKDIDIFLSNAQYIPYLSPRLNDVVADVTEAYDEMSNYLKLRFPGLGEIDFIVAPLLTSPGYIEREICGVTTRIETPIEIVVKKVFYRASELTQRDAIDIALVLEKMPSVAFSAPLLWAKREALAVRLRFLASHFDRFAIALKPGYEHLAKESVQILESWLKRTDTFPADLGPGPRGNLGPVDRR